MFEGQPTSLSASHDPATKFILLKDQVGSIITKKLFSFGAVVNKVTRSNSFNALKGSLYKIVLNQDNIPSGETITLVSVDNEEHFIQNCHLKDLRLLSDEEFSILLAIPSCQERNDAINSNDGKSKLTLAMERKKDSIVEVYDEKGEKKIGIGFLKDPVPAKNKTKKATYFQVLLEQTDSVVDHTHIGEEKCDKHNMMTVPLNRIRFLSEDSKEKKRKVKQSNVNIGDTSDQKHQKVKGKSENSVQHKDPETLTKGKEQDRNTNTIQKQTSTSTAKKNKNKNKKEDTTNLSVGSRVIYVPDGGKLNRGVVRFIGNVGNDGLFAGVELDESGKSHKNILGNYYQGKVKLFDAEYGRGVIVRPQDLRKEEEYPAECSSGKMNEKKTYVTVTDHVNGLGGHDLQQKEVKNPEVKNTDIVKEQEEMFRKFKEERKYNSMDMNYNQNYSTSQGECRDREQDMRMHDQGIQKIKNQYGIETPSNKAANENLINSYNSHVNVEVPKKVSETVHISLNKQNNMAKRKENGHNVTESAKPKELTNEQKSLQLEDMVEIMIQKKLYYGVLKWIGKHERTPDIMAGIELEGNDIKACTTGTFLGKKYFHSPQGRAFFAKLHNCKRDSRFTAQADVMVDESKQICNTNVSIKGSYLPITKLVEGALGVNKGIQGHYNSCYMDSTLFAMFAYSHVFDVILNRKKRKNDVEDYDIIKDILKEQIVNPLRRFGYVDYQSVFELRKYLNNFTDAGGFMNEEKDPEELFVLLFEKVLKVDPLIKIHVKGEKGNEQVSHLYQLFTPKEQQNPLPSIQYLLETSFLTSKLQLGDVPSVMILQMPRFGQEKMYQRVQITSKLDIAPLLVNVAQKCVICDQKASIHCEDCACQFGGWEVVHTYFCESCCHAVHKHPKRSNHQINKLSLSIDSINTAGYILELFAVVCIEKSHYVSFVKCGEGENENWVFFDSMADRVGEENGYNIPRVIEMNDLKHFLNGNPLEISELDKDNGDVIRVFDDSSLCFYHNKNLTMYR